MQLLFHMEGVEKLLPFVKMFHSTPFSFLWEDEEGTVQFIPQGEGGEQGPLCCTHWDSTRLLPSQTGFAMGNASAHFWMICMSLRILWIATRSEGKNCGTTPRYDFTMARRQCGTAEVRSLPTLAVWGEQPDSWIFSESVERGHPQYSRSKHLDSWHTSVHTRVGVASTRSQSCRTWRGRISSSGPLALFCPIQQIWSCFRTLVGVDPGAIASSAQAASNLPLALG